MTSSRKARNCFCPAFLLPLFAAPLFAASGSWFGGGSYDGSDLSSDRPGIGCPQVNNLAGATGVLSTTACLNGMLVATGAAPTTVYVYWGTTNGGTDKAQWGAPIDLGVRTRGEKLTTQVSVDPGSTYYYRFYATNTAGDEGWASASASFITPAQPVLSAAGAAPVSYATATLRGSLTAGVIADIKVYWGQNTNTWSGTNSLGVRSQGAIRCAVAGLTPGAAYYYRYYGTNTAGDGWSDTVPFTTRVESAVFAGGSFDGYAGRTELSTLFAPFRGTWLEMR